MLFTTPHYDFVLFHHVIITDAVGLANVSYIPPNSDIVLLKIIDFVLR
jgi:hypothetical protein